MTIHRLTRRTVLEGAAALGAIGCLPARLAAQSGRAEPLPARGDIVIRGANVLTMDERLGDFASGDVHVRDGAIVAVGANVDVSGAEVIDGRGMICMPGFVDTHWHLWTSMLRPFVRSDIGELSVLPGHHPPRAAHDAGGQLCSVRLGIAEALSAGVTTVHNWAHNTRSPEHADAELSAMRDAGIRGRFAYGPAQGMPDDQPMDLAGLARVKRDWMPGDGMLTLGICSRNVGGGSIGGGARGMLSIDMARKDWDGARALGLPITLHTSGPSPIKALEDAGLLGPDVQLVHPLLTTPEERAILKTRGVSYSIAPVPESRRPSNLGVIQLGELLEAGVKVSLSTDHTTNYKCDPFGAMRILFALHQHRLGNKPPADAEAPGAARHARRRGRSRHRRQDRLAHAGQARRHHPGAHHRHQHDAGRRPLRGAGLARQPGNVDTVIVDGRILRRQGKFTALDHGKAVREAREAAAAVRDQGEVAGVGGGVVSAMKCRSET